MARKKSKTESEFVLFDVVYEDGSLRSNRRVPSSELGGFDGDAPALGIIEAQDREIGAMAGQSRPAIKSITRTPVR